MIDAAMVDGVGVLRQMSWACAAAGRGRDERGSQPARRGRPVLRHLRLRRRRYVAVGAHRAAVLRRACWPAWGWTDEDLPDQTDRPRWPRLRSRFTEVFASRTRDEWAAVFAGTDACVAPVLSFAEAAAHPHLAARGISDHAGRRTPGRARPTVLAYPPRPPSPPPKPGADTAAVLADWDVLTAISGP